MHKNKVMISQSNYIPWKGFFDAINAVDTYVIFDEVQYTKRDWRNRNKIKTPNGEIWLTIPVEVKGKFNQKISETRISDSQWAQQHWSTICHNYTRAPYFKELSPLFQSLYQEASQLEYLSEVNYLFLTSICKLLGIKTKFANSSDFNLIDGKSERILCICQELLATDYFTGPTAKNYMNEEIFSNCGISVHYYDFKLYEEYEQLYPPFEHAVSIIDLLFAKGPDSAASYIFRNSTIPTKAKETSPAI